MIAVVGASSTLGSRVVHRLLEQGMQVRAVSRDPKAKLAGLQETGAEVMRADLRDPASLAQVVAGADTVVSCAHAMAPPDRHNTTLAVDRDGNCRLVDAARQAGVQHLVLISVSIASPNAPCVFAQMKEAAEDCLRGSGLNATIVRPTVFMETHVLLLLGEPLRSTGKVQIFGHGQTLLNYVSVDDVAQAVTDLIVAGPSAGCRSVDVGGPETFTRMQTLGLLEQALGRQTQTRHVPLLVMQLMKTLSRPFNPSLSYLIDFSIAEDTHPEAFLWTPKDGDIVGKTRLETVIERWATRQPAA